ncbi:MAG: hypothetical protein HOW73_44980 [Polyangiaceae bacterium]|nr:hypothetical protein [Polyangiaceae bacterium]
MTLLFSLSFAGCQLLSGLDDLHADGAPTSSSTGGGGGTAGGPSNGGGGAGQGGGSPECPIPQEAECMPEAQDGCAGECTNGSTCLIECPGDSMFCETAPVDDLLPCYNYQMSPTQMNCEFDCGANEGTGGVGGAGTPPPPGACADRTIECPKGPNQCKVDCHDGGCVDATIQCGDGPCIVNCTMGGCGNTTVNCGKNACIVNCSMSMPPTVNAGPDPCVPPDVSRCTQ